MQFVKMQTISSSRIPGGLFILHNTNTHFNYQSKSHIKNTNVYSRGNHPKWCGVSSISQLPDQ